MNTYTMVQGTQPTFRSTRADETEPVSPLNSEPAWTESRGATQYWGTGSDGTGDNNATTGMTSKQPDRKGIVWQDPLLALAIFIGSTLLAVGHHLYYQSLHGTQVQSEMQQTWAIRIGTGFAFLVKTGLGCVLSLVAVQQLWATLRAKSMTVGAIDCAFDLMNNPFAVFSKDLLGNAKLLLILTLVYWAIPLIAIFTPAALSVQLQTVSNVVQTTVPAANFTNFTNWASFEGPGYIEGASFDAGRLFTRVYSSQSFIPHSAPFPNVSYELDFWGPSYRCLNGTDYISENNKPSWDVTDVVPYTTFEEALNKELGLPATKNLTNLYRAVSPLYMNNIILLWVNGYDPWVCQLYNTSYRVHVQFEDGIQAIAPLTIDFLEPQSWDDSAGSESALDSLCNPASTDDCSQATPTYYATHLLFSRFLSIDIRVGATGQVSFGDGSAVTTPLVQSALIECPEIWNNSLYSLADEGTRAYRTASGCRNGSLAGAIEDLSRNFTYSAMTFAEHANVRVPVTVRTPRNFYSYQWSTLLASYLAGVVATLLCIGVGVVAIWRNGVTSSTSFSTIMLTTRNPDLDRLIHDGDCLGAKPLKGDIAATKLQFGRLQSHELGFHAGFGLEDTVARLVSKGTEVPTKSQP